MTLLLKTDPECAVAKDRNGDTALHMACRHTQKNIYRKTVEQLLVSADSHVFMHPYLHVPILSYAHVGMQANCS